ncbi:MAG: nucleoside hydrolase [Gemmataceae bacterium]
MATKVLLIADPGIDAAFAIALALNDPDLEVVALAATAGHVPADQATRNCHIVIEQIDPVRWPRVGAALPIDYDRHALDLHGPDGLGGQDFPCVPLHNAVTSDRLILDMIRQHPDELSIVQVGPATALARAFDRDPEVARLIPRLVIVGGTWQRDGDVTPCAEFHFWCDPLAARQVLRSGAPITLIPVDVTHKMVFSPNDLRHLGAVESRTAAFLRRVVPMLLAPTAGRYGIEGVYLPAALGVALLTRPDAFTLKAVAADVETRGDLTRGMTVFDTRWSSTARPNLDVVTDFEVQQLRSYIHHVLGESRN